MSYPNYIERSIGQAVRCQKQRPANFKQKLLMMRVTGWVCSNAYAALIHKGISTLATRAGS